MEALELNAEPREVVKRGLKGLREQGFVPAVVYGKDVEAKPLKVEARALDRVLAVAGSHQLISLKVGKQKAKMTLARDVQRDVIRRHYLHVDFYAVKMDEKVNAQVPLVVVGVSPAVRDLGGVLTQNLDQLEIECLPSDLISSIEINIDGLIELHDGISVSDLDLPDTITILSDPASAVVRVEAPRLVTEEEEAEEGEEVLEEGVEPEVITEAKSDDEE